METALSLESSYFSCFILLEDGIVTRPAPIVKYMKGWSQKRVIEYANKKGWKYQELD